MYGIPNCDTVKKAKLFFENNNVEIEFVNFKKTPPDRELITKWEKATGELPVNKKGTTYKKFKDEYEKLSETKKINFLIEQSSMIKRPIVEKNGKVLGFGFNEAEYREWIK
jgi:Spx/MgsR family transcriptional regulator